MLTVRDVIPKPQPLASGEFSTIRLRLLKIAVRIEETASSNKAGVRCQLPRRRLVPRFDWRVDPAPNVSGGTGVPVKSCPINLQRLTDTL